MCDAQHASSVPSPPFTRRQALTAAGTGLLVAGVSSPETAVAGTGRAPVAGASRSSRITGGTTLVHADLHNHSLLSDGDGDPALAFASMRAAGLDVAALTDHATFSDNALGDLLTDALPPDYHQAAGLTASGWERTRGYADAANQDDAFTAIRGFEWSNPLLGHVNVWFSEHYVDVLQAGLMAPFLAWLRRKPGLVLDGAALDGGGDGIAGFNHPGREPGRFEEFRFDPRLRDRMVSLEMFNRGDDYLFEGHAEGRTSPLVACLGAGWRTGLSGVTDEHGTDWGEPEGKGRTGLWVAEHSRSGVRAAMLARRFFATRTSGLRVDATASVDGAPAAPMGSQLRTAGGDVTFTLDLARDEEWWGRPLQIQVLRPGSTVPDVVAAHDFTVGGPVALTVPLRVADGDWVVLRVADPALPNATPGPEGHPANAHGIAYTSPWWLVP